MTNLHEILPVGKNNAISSADLCEQLNISCRRNLEDMVQAERMEGHLICSGSRGYYMPADRTETLQFLRMMEKAAVSRFKTISNFRKALDIPDGQMTIDEVIND